MNSHANLKSYFTKSDNEDFNITPKPEKQVLSEFYSKYPESERWRLLVDGQLYDQRSEFGKKEDAWLNYEGREHNSIRSFFTAFEFCLKNSPTKINVEFLKELHKLVVADLTDHYGLPLDISPGTFNQSRKQFDFSLERGTQEGLASILDEIESGYLKEAYIELRNGVGARYINSIDIFNIRKQFNCQNNSDLARVLFINYDEAAKKREEEMGDELYRGFDEDIVVKQYKIFYKLVYVSPPYECVEQLIIDGIENHYYQFAKAVSLDQKLEVIGKTIERFERIHPFQDANGRVFVNLLLNYFLIFDMGLPPATFYQPNLYDIYGNHADVIKKAIMNTVSIYHAHEQNLTIDLFGMESKNIPYERQGKRNYDTDSHLVMEKILRAAHEDYNKYIVSRANQTETKSPSFPNSFSAYQPPTIEYVKEVFTTNIKKIDFNANFTMFSESTSPFNQFLSLLKDCYTFEAVIAATREIYTTNNQPEIKKIFTACIAESMGYDATPLKKVNDIRFFSQLEVCLSVFAIKQFFDACKLKPMQKPTLEKPSKS